MVYITHTVRLVENAFEFNRCGERPWGKLKVARLSKKFATILALESSWPGSQKPTTELIYLKGHTLTFPTVTGHFLSICGSFTIIIANHITNNSAQNLTKCNKETVV